MGKIESGIQSAVCEYLEVLERLGKLMYWRQNTGGTYSVKRQIFLKPSRHAKSGVPDVIVIKDGKFIGLEMKQKGKSQSDEQILFENLVTKNKGQYHIITSVDDLLLLNLNK